MSIESTLRHAASLADEIKPTYCRHKICKCTVCTMYRYLVGFIGAQLKESGSRHTWCAATSKLTYCGCGLDFDSWYAFITHCLPFDNWNEASR